MYIRIIILAMSVLVSGFPGVCPAADTTAPPGTQPATAPSKSSALQFRLVAADGDNSAADEFNAPDTGTRLRVLKTINLDERDVTRAYHKQGEYGDALVVMEFTKSGSEKMKELSSSHINQQLAIIYRGRLLMAATMRTTISGSANIVGGANGFTEKQAKTLADAINAEASRNR